MRSNSGNGCGRQLPAPYVHIIYAPEHTLHDLPISRHSFFELDVTGSSELLIVR
jgi:hypothetical protein